MKVQLIILHWKNNIYQKLRAGIAEEYDKSNNVSSLSAEDPQIDFRFEGLQQPLCRQ